MSRYIEVDDNVHMRDVQASACYICRNQYWPLFRFEFIQSTKSFWLKMQSSQVSMGKNVSLWKTAPR